MCDVGIRFHGSVHSLHITHAERGPHTRTAQTHNPVKWNSTRNDAVYNNNIITYYYIIPSTRMRHVYHNH